MTARHFDAETRTWTPAPPRHCLTCGVELVARTGRGGRVRYCADHGPIMRAYMSRYYAAHREPLLDYQRQRNGSRAVVERMCITPDCGRRWRGYVDTCPRCRQAFRWAVQQPDTKED